ncbi:zinc-binding dehydrogenase [Actinocrispum wychmicini]|uniref:NADPH2:quinone reductase n=1 Tax=Actinocrispum wychmicini TaxID=1213861 RepID=A0A4R2JV71_9PSEU|nr:zinc-binding dehydrogenase [Actinocrispum wychmicini]TCO60939.1 NADPH2:quinone reductase [Actinocrispum wychmicini]
MTSHAIRQYEFGPAEKLLFEEVRAPVPGPGQVRVAVAAAGVHLIDTTIRRGVEGGPFPLPALPMTPGREVAGVVDVLGADVPAEWSGRRVVAHLGQASGGYAESVVANVASLHEIPPDLSFADAVAMIGTGRTVFAVLDVAQVRADDVVLVSAAAGGMGSLLVQAAKNAGAFVVGLAGGAEKVELVRGLGADVAVDYRVPDWPQRVERPVTLVLDGVGGESGRQAFELLAPGGRIVLYGASGGFDFTKITTADLFTRGVSATAAIGPRIMARPGGVRDFETLSLAAAGRGELRPLTSTFPLAKAAEAHRALEARETVGKVVLVA